MNLTTATTVRELASEIPAATRVFRKRWVSTTVVGVVDHWPTRALMPGVEFKEVANGTDLGRPRSSGRASLSNRQRLESLINHIVGQASQFYPA